MTAGQPLAAAVWLGLEAAAELVVEEPLAESAVGKAAAEPVAVREIAAAVDGKASVGSAGKTTAVAGAVLVGQVAGETTVGLIAGSVAGKKIVEQIGKANFDPADTEEVVSAADPDQPQVKETVTVAERTMGSQQSESQQQQGSSLSADWVPRKPAGLWQEG